MATPTVTPAPTGTAPADTPDPAANTAAGNAGNSTLVQLLSPVQPARPTTPLGTTAALAQDSGDTNNSGTGRSGKSDSTGQDTSSEGVVATLVRALAERLRRTGTATTIKRNHDVKETRVSGATSTTANTSKADRLAKDDRSAQHRDHRDAKLADLNNKASQHHGRTNHDAKRGDTRDTKASDTRTGRNDHSGKNHLDRRDARDTKGGNTSSSKDDRTTRDNKTSGGTGAGAKSGRDVVTTSRPDGLEPHADKTRDPKTPKNGGPQAGTAAKTSSDRTPKQDPKGLDAKTAPAKEPGKHIALDPAKPGDPTTRKPGTGDTTKKTADPKGLTAKTNQAPKAKPRTQPAREAGYRDGGRAAAAVGHVKAYRDGARDGWDERTAADQADKRRMDTNRDRNALHPKKPATPPLAPATGSTADLAKTAVTGRADQPPGPGNAPAIPAKPATAPTVSLKKPDTGKKPAPAADAKKTTAPADHRPPVSSPTARTTTKPTGQPGENAMSSNQATAPAPSKTPAPPPRSANQPAPAKDAAAPVQNVAVGEKDITFTSGAALHSLSRGEVRTLRQFERRLTEKKEHLARFTDDNKVAREHATEHAIRAQQLAEDAKAVKGGMTLVMILYRLAERAAALRARTEEVGQQTTRGIEALGVLDANAKTRHGGIYQAVVDSPLTAPAERTFYRDSQGG